jgi:uncharacterized repeat protein (TIGR03803 family)
MKTHVTTFHNGSGICAMTEPLPGRKPVLALPIQPSAFSLEPLAFLKRLLWAAALMLPAFGAQAGVVLTTLHSFQFFPNGENPLSGLVQGSDGFFYGTTYQGGNGLGTVFKISTNGALTTLYEFGSLGFTALGFSLDGANSFAGLVQGADGYLYGTTGTDGNYGGGTVFKISTNGALTILYSFTGGNDGRGPGALVQGSDGYFYGTTEHGGADTYQFDPNVYLDGLGTVFRIGSNGAFTTLYSFGTVTNAQGQPLDGALPNGLVQGSDGYFYGTTEYGGTFGNNGNGLGIGTVFKISTDGAFTTLCAFGTFTNANGDALDGGNPTGRLVQGSDGNFYGTAGGTAFKISTNGTLTTLCDFGGYLGISYPGAALVQGSDGNFYGTSEGGTYAYGAVFKISTNGVLTTLYSFDGPLYGDKDSPNIPTGPLVQGSDGSFYDTSGGGPDEAGTVFKISTNGVLTSLYSFTGGDDGGIPTGLVQGRDGNFYGATDWGGQYGYQFGDIYGTIFQISPGGALTNWYSFGFSNYVDGADPNGLVQGSDGSFYGTTYDGIYYNHLGSVFKITTNGALTYLYSFTGINDGAFPTAGLVQGSDGYLYGTTVYSGVNGNGTHGYGNVFKISTNGAFTPLYSFGTVTNVNGQPQDGANPIAGLVQGSDGYFYGTTEYGGKYDYSFSYSHSHGTVFKISSNGVLTTLYAFGSIANAYSFALDGENPTGGLVQGSDGNFYGTTSQGGTNLFTPFGTVFKISTNGVLTTLYSFGAVTNATGQSLDGGSPSGLVQGSDGYFYGTTVGGGANKVGTVFRISTNGAFTSLYSFSRNDGAGPNAGLVQVSDGSFYGTTSFGGQGGVGTVFRLTIVPEFQVVTLTNSTLSLTWSTEAGGTYQLQYNSGLSSGNWSNLGSAITSTGATLSTTDSLTNAPQRFYRLVLSP